MAHAVLNPTLYDRLARHFGSVRISKEGEEMRATQLLDPITGRRLLDFSAAGEYYAVNCCFCNDTRYRLYINHRWGQRDAWGRLGRYLAICFNEDCLADEENWTELTDILCEMDGVLERARIYPGKQAPATPPVATWPGRVVRLDQLPAGHAARHYAQQRGFDPDMLGRCYGVRYCEDSRLRYVRHRLIIPVFSNGILMGWQARYLGELDWKGPERGNLPPKYFTMPGMRKSQLVYNLDRACAYRTVVIVEGVTDVWSVGSMGVCLFGNTASAAQLRLLVAACSADAAVILLLDPEEYLRERTTKLMRELSWRFPGRFASVRLPEGYDPGSLDRIFLRTFVAEHAADVGVTVSYDKILEEKVCLE